MSETQPTLSDSIRFGEQLIESAALPEQILNQLFAALLLTAAGVFIGANLLLLHLPTLFSSAWIASACFGLLLLFYMLSRQTGSLLWGVVLTCGAAWLTVFSRQPWLVLVVRAASIGSLLYALRFLRVARHELPTLFLMAAAATAAITGMEAYTSFDMLPRLHSGELHQDTLFLASIAAMIKKYGVVSTGLHGLVNTPYHVFSHTLMACISLLSGASVLETYGVANPLLLAPLLIFSVTACCATLDRSRHLSLPLLWGTVVMLLAALPVLFGWWMILQRPFFISESYVFSLSLFSLSLILLYQRQLFWSDILLTVILAAMISNAKASTGLFFAGLWLSRLLFVRGNSLWRDAAATLAAAAAAGWVMFASAQAVVSGKAVAFSLCSFVRQFSLFGSHLDAAINALHTISIKTALLAAAALISFFSFHFLLSWTVIGMTSHRFGMKGLLRTPLGVYSSAALLAGVLVICILWFPGGSAGYFSNVAFFTSLPGAAALLTKCMQRHILPQKMLFIALAVICCLEWNGFLKTGGASHRRYTDGSQNRLISHLVALRNSSPAHIVLRADDDDLTNNPVQRCTARPFIFPAVSERAWTGVLEKGCAYVYYGYASYGITDEQATLKIPPVLLPGMILQDENINKIPE
ncbi:hypothetical protein [Candidatus Electronema sp. JM]|uniref:hypothetical protein n=1 Tax=Candidatus Electronema sp. JM TaxID=3401571 RepID=UPI003AA7D678